MPPKGRSCCHEEGLSLALRMSFNHHRVWKSWEKILFRMFFPFLILQILTQDFTGNLFGGSRVVWDLGDRIFTPPGLWLNARFFHFGYSPPAWSTFSAALHTIRDIVYLLFSFVVCVVWSILDRGRENYNRQLYWFSQALIMVLSCIVFAYGIVKVFPVQMAAPSFSTLQSRVGDLRPFDLLWTTYGYGSPYQTFTGVFEAMSAILILFSRTRVAGLLIIVSVMINVILLNYTFQIGVLMLSFYVLLVALFLLAPYARPLADLFFLRQSVSLRGIGYVPASGLKTLLPKVVGGVLLAASFVANTLYVDGIYKRRDSVKRSAQYFRVKHFVLNGDELRPWENDTLCWRWWNERTTAGKRYVTVTPMKLAAAKTYTIERDTVRQSLTLEPLEKGGAPLHFKFTPLGAGGWQLEGAFGGGVVRAELLLVGADTAWRLLRTQRTIIALKDGEDQ